MAETKIGEVKGQISDISFEKRKIAVLTKEQTFEILTWTPGLDAKMGKQKSRWFVQITYTGEGEAKVINTCEYWEKPEDWPQQQYSGKKKGSYGKSPEERKDIRLMACLKAAVDMWHSPCMEDEDDLLSYEETCKKVAGVAVEMEKVLSGESK